MSSIKDNLKKVTAQLPEGVRLIAVSKFHPVEELAEAYEAGQRLFGENRAQELVAKAPELPFPPRPRQYRRHRNRVQTSVSPPF